MAEAKGIIKVQIEPDPEHFKARLWEIYEEWVAELNIPRDVADKVRAQTEQELAP